MYTVKDKNNKDKISGRSRGKVIDNRDPEKRGRIRVDHPALGETTWIPYLRTPGIFSVPQVGDLVYVECDCGFYEYPITWGNLTKGKGDNVELPDVFKEDIVPRNMGMFTPGGHLFEMHDGKADPTSDPSKHTEFVTKSGIRWTSINGHKIHINDQDDKIEIRTEDGSYIVIDKPNKQINVNSEGTINVVAAEDITVVTPANVTTQCTEFTVEASSKVKLDTPATEVTGTAKVTGDTTLEANLQVTGNATMAANLQVTGIAQLGGAAPLLLATAQMVGIGNLGIPVISSVMSGLTTKALGA